MGKLSDKVEKSRKREIRKVIIMSKFKIWSDRFFYNKKVKNVIFVFKIIFAVLIVPFVIIFSLFSKSKS